MTAAELYDIVKDVPREAWPECMFYNPHDEYPPFWKWITPTDQRDKTYAGCGRNTDEAELLFVGSMTKWRADSTANESEEKCRDSLTIFANWCHEDGRVGYLVTINGFGNCTHPHSPDESWFGTTLVAALAAACKAVKE